MIFRFGPILLKTTDNPQRVDRQPKDPKNHITQEIRKYLRTSKIPERKCRNNLLDHKSDKRVTKRVQVCYNHSGHASVHHLCVHANVLHRTPTVRVTIESPKRSKSQTLKYKNADPRSRHHEAAKICSKNTT